MPHTDLQRLRWTLASDDVVSLQGVEVIDLARLEAETRTARAPA